MFSRTIKGQSLAMLMQSQNAFDTQLIICLQGIVSKTQIDIRHFLTKLKIYQLSAIYGC